MTSGGAGGAGSRGVWDPERVAARLVVGLGGPQLTAREAAWLERWRPAGVILFGRNVTGPAQLAALCRRLRELLGPGAEIMADQEGGPVSVLAAALGRPPAPFGLGRLGDPELTRRVHAETAARLRDVGVTRALAPCADVLVEMGNPVIGVRAFGAEPRGVADQVAAAVRGLREGGVGACLKHWPGHGGTAGDSHDGPVSTGRGALVAPFLAGLAAGADAVMVGHLPDPESGAGSDRPATLDPAALARLRGLAPGARPLLIADDVTMGALRPAFGAAPGGLVEPSALTLDWLAGPAAAGCDFVLCRGLPEGALPMPASAAAGARAPVIGAAAAAAADPAGGVPPDPPAWREARRREARASGDPFPAGAERLVWADATAGDRWGDASMLAPLVRARFGSGWLRPGDREQAPRCAAVLVTSHRPLGDDLRADLSRDGLLAEAGGCLVMGHPSLEGSVTPVLPAGWRVAALHDIDAAAWRALIDVSS